MCTACIEQWHENEYPRGTPYALTTPAATAEDKQTSLSVDGAEGEVQRNGGKGSGQQRKCERPVSIGSILPVEELCVKEKRA